MYIFLKSSKDIFYLALSQAHIFLSLAMAYNESHQIKPPFYLLTERIYLVKSKRFLTPIENTSVYERQCYPLLPIPPTHLIPCITPHAVQKDPATLRISFVYDCST